jgi:membrane-bound lytic murein transglycosylase B
MMLVHPAFAQTQSFEQWLAEFRIDAKARGISDKIFDEALGNAKPISQSY